MHVESVIVLPILLDLAIDGLTGRGVAFIFVRVGGLIVSHSFFRPADRLLLPLLLLTKIDFLLDFLARHATLFIYPLEDAFAPFYLRECSSMRW